MSGLKQFMSDFILLSDDEFFDAKFMFNMNFLRQVKYEIREKREFYLTFERKILKVEVTCV